MQTSLINTSDVLDAKSEAVCFELILAVKASHFYV